jgi:hypothetical protein
MCKFRELNADEIKARVAMTSDKGLQILLYKDARVDMAILDETVGSARWQREHYSVDGVNYCRVGIKIDNEWIWKSDCGSESNTEAEKGEASDSFKRACVCWGIGRSLYTAPFIWVKAGEYSLNSKGKPADTFSVSAIDIQDGVIKGLTIKNDKSGKIVYTYGTLRGKAPEAHEKAAEPQLPFPDVPPAPAKPSSVSLPGLAPTPQMSREDAAKVTVMGVTLTELYKTNKAGFMAVLNECPDPHTKEAARVIYEWVKEFSKNN